MANNYFQFKQFIIHQDRCSMKVGTDGVLLGAWTNPDSALKILDVGSGTGLIALMLAQRSKRSEITAVEIEEQTFIQASENIKNSSFKNQIKILHTDFNDLSTDVKYDLIVSNPPFFDAGTPSPSENRKVARHQINLTIQSLIKRSSELLNNNGRLAMIIPIACESSAKESAENNNLFTTKLCRVFPNETKKSKRVLLEFSRSNNPLIEQSLIIEKARHQYTDDARALFKDFYLNL